MSAATVRPTTVTIQGTCIAHTSIRESIEIPAGAPLTELLPSVLSAIDDLRTSPWSGETSSDDTWEIQITMRPSDGHGLVESLQKLKEKRSQRTTEKSLFELWERAWKEKLDT